MEGVHYYSLCFHGLLQDPHSVDDKGVQDLLVKEVKATEAFAWRQTGLMHDHITRGRLLEEQCRYSTLGHSLKMIIPLLYYFIHNKAVITTYALSSILMVVLLDQHCCRSCVLVFQSLACWSLHRRGCHWLCQKAERNPRPPAPGFFPPCCSTPYVCLQVSVVPDCQV